MSVWRQLLQPASKRQWHSSRHSHIMSVLRQLAALEQCFFLPTLFVVHYY